MNREHTRDQLVARIAKQRDEITQYFNDLEHWNRTHPNEHIDGDPDGQMAKMLNALNATLAREQRIKER